MKTYLIKMFDKNETFLKVGFTSLENEFDRHNFGDTPIIESNLSFDDKIKMVKQKKKYVPFSGYESVSIHTEYFDYEGQAKLLENKVLTNFKNIKYQPQKRISGYTECFIFSDDNLSKIKKYMIEQAKSIKMETPDKIRYLIFDSKIRKDDPIERHLEIVNMWKAQQDS